MTDLGSERVPAPPLSAALGARLSAMMFLQYAIWGAWLPLLWPFLSDHRGLSGGQIGNILAVGAVGAILAPFIAGQIADRHVATEKFLGLSHLLGAAVVWQLARVEAYGAFLALSLLYSLIYAPTLSLTNSLAFHHMPDRDRDFGRVRVWGTVGWIVVGIGIGQWLLRRHTPLDAAGLEVVAAQAAGMADAFRLSAVLGLLMGLYCFTLPATPPSRADEANAPMRALKEVRGQPLLTLFLLAVPISCIHQFYFVHTAGFLQRYQTDAADLLNRIFGVGGAGLMTLGQMSEIVVLAAIPVVAKSVSRKTFLAVGIAAYALRFLIFAQAESLGLGAVVFGVALHGLCFGCFIFVAFMIVDEESGADVRASAQSLFNVVIVGVGTIVGSKIAGWVADWATLPGGELDYQRLFSVPLWASTVCLVVLMLFYPGGRAAQAGEAG